ncbi:uncharacterized protein LOC117314759 isoform X2 [Pecten maximus]|uniref:uncharacterized protein LOC117314759 isoform X2 n=1 Tax=Pecten maximus TaxID=6579 RepID=UPI00145885A4|nr:uncharacterized protein LOC117314759 isoform X2 [Pecten maximus]
MKEVLIFPDYKHSQPCSTNNGGGTHNRPATNSTSVDDTTMVSSPASLAGGQTCSPTQHTTDPPPNQQTQQGASYQEPSADCMQIIWDRLEEKGISKESADSIMGAWRDSTKRQYGVHLRRRLLFCREPLCSSVKNVIDFLQTMFDRNLSYSSINTAKSCISSLLEITGSNNIMQDSLIQRFMKGVFHKRPTLPRYSNTWDVSVVLGLYTSKLKLL